jgi:prepilin-type N-terminal cleavage/methylation domain-containing protein
MKHRRFQSERRDRRACAAGSQRRILRTGVSRIGREAFTLVELLIVVVLISILASVSLLSMDSSTAHSLETTSRMLVADLRLARNQAIQFNSEYTIQFDLNTQTYEIVHSGTGTLPVPQNSLAGSAADKDKYIQPVQKDALNLPDQVVIRQIYLKTSGTDVKDVAFGPMGGTGPDRSEDTVIVLSTTRNGITFQIPITVSWITGQAWADDIQNQ